MKALIFDPTAPGGLRLGEVPEPTPKPSQALVDVHAVSLNWAEASALARLCKPGDVPGWDAAASSCAPRRMARAPRRARA